MKTNNSRIMMVVALAIFMAYACVVSGCATMQLDTPEKKYLAARSELNLLLQQYIQVQHHINDTDHAIAKEAFFTAAAALDAWGGSLGQPGYSPMNDIQVWLKMKNTILRIIGGLYGQGS